MISSPARSVDEYLSQLPADRRAALSELRRLIQQHLPRGFEEGIHFGMIGYCVPLSRYPNTYNGQPLGIVSLASQKQYISLYLMAVYGDPAKERRLTEAFRKAGKKLDMGKSCVRFKSLDDLPLEAIAEVVAGTSVDDFIALYEAARKPTAKKKAKKAARKARL
jgi:uncharacterized protein YdhG (YjbR/CyaY superfamily)